MAPITGNDGLLSHLRKFTPQALGRTMPHLDVSGLTAHEAGGLTETAAFGGNPGNLRMLSYVPEALPAGSPLVVVLHGCTQTAADYDRGTGWSTLAEHFGFALLLPEQRRGNNGNLCFDWFQPEDITRGSGEVASIVAMVAAMIATHGLQARRVYVTGLSAGAAMTAALLATYPDVFAGGAIIAGLPFGSASGVAEAFGVMSQGRIRSARELGDRVRAASPHRGPWPTVSIWQGTSDTTVNPVNADELRKQWTDVHGVADAAPTQSTVDGASHRLWQAADERAVVETYVINGLGHATPIDPQASDGRDFLNLFDRAELGPGRPTPHGAAACRGARATGASAERGARAGLAGFPARRAGNDPGYHGASRRSWRAGREGFTLRGAGDRAQEGLGKVSGACVSEAPT
jgi:poly(hydroxyalkanoate) depolymerase family esterase